ncbi:ABC transporter, sugar binding protein [Enterococcus sp. HSIEG1]|nr:ABC transporter, sugar binding protein [Enterococcus sp. HSIEG1]
MKKKLIIIGALVAVVAVALVGFNRYRALEKENIQSIFGPHSLVMTVPIWIRL